MESYKREEENHLENKKRNELETGNTQKRIAKNSIGNSRIPPKKERKKYCNSPGEGFMFKKY